MNERFSLRSLYLYAVCFATLLITIFAGVNLVRNAVEVVYPDPMRYPASPPAVPGGGEVDPEVVERQERAARESQRRDAVLGLVTSGTLLVIAVPTYIYHWRRIQAERAAVRPSDPAQPADS